MDKKEEKKLNTFDAEFEQYLWEGILLIIFTLIEKNLTIFITFFRVQ